MDRTARFNYRTSETRKKKLEIMAEKRGVLVNQILDDLIDWAFAFARLKLPEAKHEKPTKGA